MSKALFIVFYFCAIPPTIARDAGKSVSSDRIPANSVSSAHRRGWHVTTAFNIGYSWMDNVSTGSSNSSMKGSTGVGSSLGVGYMFNNHIGIFTGCSRAGYNYNLNQSSKGISIDYKQVYNEIPLYLRLITSNDGRYAFAANAGFKIGLIDHAIKKYNGFEERSNQGLKKTALSFVAYPAINVSLDRAGTGELTIGPEFQYSLTQNFDNDQTYYLTKSRGYLAALMLKVAVNFRIGT